MCVCVCVVIVFLRVKFLYFIVFLVLGKSGQRRTEESSFFWGAKLLYKYIQEMSKKLFRDIKEQDNGR